MSNSDSKSGTEGQRKGWSQVNQTLQGTEVRAGASRAQMPGSLQRPQSQNCRWDRTALPWGRGGPCWPWGRALRRQSAPPLRLAEALGLPPAASGAEPTVLVPGRLAQVLAGNG